jgi:hypothetical protein
MLLGNKKFQEDLQQVKKEWTLKREQAWGFSK